MNKFEITTLSQNPVLFSLCTIKFRRSCAFTSKDFDHPVEGTPEKDCWQDWHHFNLKMTSAQDVEPSVTSKGPSQDSFDPDDQIPQRYAAPVFKLFSSDEFIEFFVCFCDKNVLF